MNYKQIHWPLTLHINNTNEIIFAIENAIELNELKLCYNLALVKYNAISTEYRLHKKFQFQCKSLANKIKKYEKINEDSQNDLVIIECII